MSDLNEHVHEYLRMRRAFGFKLIFAGHVLPQFVGYLEATGATSISVEAAIAWAGLPVGVAPISRSHRLGAVRGFARYLATIDPATEVPPAGIWPSAARRPTPYLWSDADIRSLLDGTRRLNPPLRAATHETVLGLLAATGMRVSEAVGLRRYDLDLETGVITIRDAKFGRSRLIPLHDSTISALRAYGQRRDDLCPEPRSAAFFVSNIGTALAYASVHHAFIEVTTAIGLRTATVKPRVHDLRHSFAVRTLINWHRSGVDIDGRMPILSNYLGHVNPSGTYWYLSASPELMELAADRLESRFGTPR
jgi:integrase/recombinase XerD